jgi:DNA-binding response OmpR family regulator
MYNILICDDEKDIVSALKIYLSSEGYRTWRPAAAPRLWNLFPIRKFT